MGDFYYDTDDVGFDQYEFEQEYEGTGEGMFIKYSDAQDKAAGVSKPQNEGPVASWGEQFEDEVYYGVEECRPGEDPNHMLEEDYQALLTADEVYVNQVSGYPDVWAEVEAHSVYYAPWYSQYEHERQQERYWNDHWWEKKRKRDYMQERYQANERVRRDQKHRKIKQYWNPEHHEERKEKARLAMRKMRAKESPEKREERLRKDRERKRLKRLQARKEGN